MENESSFVLETSLVLMKGGRLVVVMVREEEMELDGELAYLKVLVWGCELETELESPLELRWVAQ